MKHFTSYKYLFYGICVTMFGSLQSCITDNYDLSKDVDIQVSFTPEGFNLAGDNSADIPLSQVIELDEDGELTTDAAGNYLFYKKSDDIDPTTVTVGQGSLCNGTDEQYSFPVSALPSLTIKKNRFMPEISTVDFDLSMNPTYKPDKQGKAVRELIYIKTPMEIAVDMIFENLRGSIYEDGTYIDKITYEVPYFYDLVDDADLVEENVNVTEGHSHNIRIKGVDFTKTPTKAYELIDFNGTTGKFTMKGEVKVKFHIQNIKTEEFDGGKDVVAHIRVMCGTLGTTEVTGRFNNHESVAVDPVSFDNLPDFIRGDEVVIDVENPIIRMSLDNEVPATISMNAKLKNIRDNKLAHELLVGEDYGTDAIRFLGNQQTNIWISRSPVAIPDSVNQNVVIPNMMDLISQMPERIEIDAEARTDSNEVLTLSLGNEYKATPSYELYAPLIMGKNMKIVYKKDIKNLQDKVKHVSISTLKLTTDITNNIPLDLKLTVTPLDVNNKEIEGIEITVPEEVPANSTRHIVCELKNKTSDNAISRLDRIKVKAYASSSEALQGKALNKNQNLIMKNVHITITSPAE